MKDISSTCLAGPLARLLVAVCGAWASNAVAAGQVDVPAAEKAAFEKSFHADIGPRTLHEEPVSFMDGAKGRVMGRPIAQQVAPVFPPGMTNYKDYKYWETLCFVPLIAIATNIDSTPFLTPSQKGLLTRDRFRIEQIIKAPDGIVPGSIVHVAREGGEVVDAGERLRVFQLGLGGPYIPKLRYFLIGFQNQFLSQNQFTQGLPPARIDGALAYVEGPIDEHDVLSSTFEVERLIQKFKTVSSRFPCQEP